MTVCMSPSNQPGVFAEPLKGYNDLKEAEATYRT
jgi:hypothetical protein